MTSKQRRDFFTKHTDEELGKFLNTEFEKAMVSKQQTAITDWAKSVFNPEAQMKPVYKSITDKIKSLNDMGVLTPKSEDAFLEDLVSEKLGISVSPEEVAAIESKAKVIDAAQKKLGPNLGNPKHFQENLDFFKAKREMDDYLQGLMPANKLKVLTGTIGRGMMLFSVKSPILNIGSNIEIGFVEALGRRIASKGVTGSNNALAIDYVKMVNKIYQATGYDLSRMTTIDDAGASGARVLGGDMVHAQGPGKVRAAGRLVEDVVFKQLMGAPDVAFSSAHFADSVNINSLKMAGGDKAKGAELMNDAMLLEPQTPQGELLRQQGILDAQVATWTNATWASKVSEGIRKILNNVSGDLRVGDYLLPFVKTPANVIATGMDYAGMGIPRSLVRTVRAWRSGDLGSKEFVQKTSRDLVRAGLGLTGALIFASMLDEDDFVGAYDPARAQIEALRNSNTNSIRIGNKWISTAWLGPLAVPVTSIMYSRKYGNTGSEKVFQYGSGVVSSAKDLPGVQDFADYFKKQAYQKENQTLEEAASATGDYVSSELYTRLVPSFISDVAKATDKFERKTGTKMDTIKSKIPGVRQTLPVKTDIFGEPMVGESALSDILFGSRMKTDKENDFIAEIKRVADSEDKSIQFTDWDRSSSKQLAQFRQKVGEDVYEKARNEYGAQLKINLEKALAKKSYQKLDDGDRLKIIRETDSDAMEKILDKYNFNYQKETPKQVAKKEGERNLVELAMAYGDAYSKDPANAFKAMFTNEQLGKVEGNLVELERFRGVDFNKEGGSEEYIKKELEKLGIPWSERHNYNLEHITPVKAGGDTSSENLYIASRAEHDSYTPIDTLAAKAVQDKKLTRKEVTRIMTNLKVNKIISLKEARDMLDK